MQKTKQLWRFLFNEGLLLLGSCAGVDLQSCMADNGLDQALRWQLGDATAGERSADLQTIGDNRRGDQLVGWDLLQQLLVCSRVHEHRVVQLITDLSLRPLLQKLRKAKSSPHGWIIKFTMNPRGQMFNRWFSTIYLLLGLRSARLVDLDFFARLIVPLLSLQSLASPKLGYFKSQTLNKMDKKIAPFWGAWKGSLHVFFRLQTGSRWPIFAQFLFSLQFTLSLGSKRSATVMSTASQFGMGWAPFVWSQSCRLPSL